MSSALRAAVVVLCFGAPARAWPELAPPSLIGGGENDAALIVGIERYAEVPGVAGATRNADDWYAWLLRGRSVPPGSVTLLRDNEGTVEKMRKYARAAASSSSATARLPPTAPTASSSATTRSRTPTASTRGASARTSCSARWRWESRRAPSLSSMRASAAGRARGRRWSRGCSLSSWSDRGQCLRTPSCSPRARAISSPVPYSGTGEERIVRIESAR